MDLAVVVAVVAVALVFAWTNGFHDAANSIATAVSTRALTPRTALFLATTMNVLGGLLGQQVANTVGSVIEPEPGTHGLVIVLAALLGAIGWNLTTWWLGLPSSSSQALIGGLLGAAVVSGSVVRWEVIVGRVLLPMLASPVVGLVGAFALMLAIWWGLRRRAPRRVQRGFRAGQTVSAAAMALGHGLQDAQKTMGVIFLVLLTTGSAARGDPLPTWVVLASALALASGTATGGWRIVRTLGRRIIPLEPAQGFAAESVSAAVLYVSAFAYEAPVSTTQTVTAAVTGAGASRRFSAVRWGVARSIVVAWVLTVPAAALLAAVVYEVCRVVVGLP